MKLIYNQSIKKFSIKSDRSYSSPSDNILNSIKSAEMAIVGYKNRINKSKDSNEKEYLQLEIKSAEIRIEILKLRLSRMEFNNEYEKKMEKLNSEADKINKEIKSFN